MPEESSGADSPAAPRTPWRVLIAVLCVATALRPSVVVVGPVLSLVERSLGLGAAGAAVLTTLPVLCFGIGALFSPLVVRRFGIDLGLLLSVVLVLIAGLLRVVAGPNVLFAGTVAVALGLAVANVLLPALVRRDFERMAGRVTGLYTSVLALFSSLAAVSAVPLVDLGRGRWETPLLVWAALTVIPLLTVLPLLRRRPARSVTPPRASLALLRGPTARNLTLFMGLQSIGFYVLVSWLPTMLQDAGLSATHAGALLSLATVLGIPAALVVPMIAADPHRQPLLAVLTTGLVALGWLGLAIAPAGGAVFWAILLGVGTGGTFPLTLMLIAMRATNPAETPQLSATAQGGGYLLAAGGPFLVGLLHDAAGSWVIPIALLLVLDVVQAVSGWAVARPRHGRAARS